MKNETLNNYDTKIKEMEKDLAEMEDYIKKHPEKLGTKGNYETYKYVYNIIKNDKAEFVKELNIINLVLKGETLNNGMKISNFAKLGNSFYETEKLTTKMITTNYNSEELLINAISEGSYKITFAFKNPTDDDVKRTSPRKRGLLKIFNFISCGDDIEKLKKEAGPEGMKALKQYKKFIGEIVKNEVDFTLDTEKGNLKAGLTLQQCKNICKNLNI